MTPASATFTESEVEHATLEWLGRLGWNEMHGPDNAPHGTGSERTEYNEVVLEHQLRDALARLNPDLPAEAPDNAFRKLTRPEGSAVEARNRALYRMLVDGVTVKYRMARGVMRGTRPPLLSKIA